MKVFIEKIVIQEIDVPDMPLFPDRGAVAYAENTCVGDPSVTEKSTLSLSYGLDEDHLTTLSKEEYDRLVSQVEADDTCYECSGYGDDYDDEGNCLCETCPFARPSE